MLIDNKNFTASHFRTLFEFLKEQTKEGGHLDIVSGYFTMGALAEFYESLNHIKHFRMILSKLSHPEESERILDLLSENSDLESAFALAGQAQKAVAFLRQENVEVRTASVFCHAKTYIFTSQNDQRKNFFVVGSSNLTEAGLGIKQSPNIELSFVKHEYEDNFKNLLSWFEDRWNESASVVKGTKYTVKEYFIHLIETLYKKYSPEDLYYKVLYELFKQELQDFLKEEEEKGALSIQETEIYKALYSFQRQAVISLVKMLKTYGGAILADAVGLGKTWTALAVMKYFELNGYTVLLLCPKKLAHNWERYKAGSDSRFKNDDIDFYVRYHTDLQEDRFDRYSDKKLDYFRSRPKLLIVIDESHNFRNDKSARYKFLVESLLSFSEKKRDVKVLALSATPINTQLKDLRNQFKLLCQGREDGFRETLRIENLDAVFRRAQEEFSFWQKKTDRTLVSLIRRLPKDFERLTDALIVARTRKLIQTTFKEELNFPKKEKPDNKYISLSQIGELGSLSEILESLENIDLAIYRPADYMPAKQVSVLKDDRQRQRYLTAMMYMLLVKRLESSWKAFQITLQNIFYYHERVLETIEAFQRERREVCLPEQTEDIEDDLEEIATEMSQQVPEQEKQYFVGKKNPIPLSEITRLDEYQKAIQDDKEKLNRLLESLARFEKDLQNERAQDPKLNTLIDYLTKKQTQQNKKMLIFTTFQDTAEYLYEQLKKRGFSRVAMVSGTKNKAFYEKTKNEQIFEDFEEILERFAPYTKLFLEKDWSELYQEKKDEKIDFERWKGLIQKHNNSTVLKKLAESIDILIATDCLSEGQNLQDCDAVLNYDIHWNPVRLIQRMGRIDRLGSPNRIVRGINFWPTADYEDYLRLQKRIEERIKAMQLVGTETPQDADSQEILTKQVQKMYEQLQQTWDDVEEKAETPSMNNLSLEQFRQELRKFLDEKKKELEKIPNGVFTGFKTPTKDKAPALIALVKYRAPSSLEDYHLLYVPLKESTQNISYNRQEILSFLQAHKSEERYVPEQIERGDKETLYQFAEKLKQAHGKAASTEKVTKLFHEGITSMARVSKPNNSMPYDVELVTWFVVSPTT
ncbi:MAG: helicase-related protein [Bacteroidia bacterium]